jgi:hypothetical protein
MYLPTTVPVETHTYNPKTANTNNHKQHKKNSPNPSKGRERKKERKRRTILNPRNTPHPPKTLPSKK